MIRRCAAVVAALLGCASVSPGQQDSTWGKWDWLLGEWTGPGSGVPGKGLGGFSLRPDLGGKILIRRGHAEYPASEKGPAVVHDDLMVIYPEAGGHAGRAIYFDGEGHVIEYGIAYPGASIVLTSGRGGGMPVFRLTYSPRASGGVDIRFEISRDGEKFSTYTEGRCRKVK